MNNFPLIEWITLYGDKRVAALWLPFAKKQARFMASVNFRPEKKIKMADGTIISIEIINGDAFIRIIGQKNIKSRFLFYEKLFSPPLNDFGYYAVEQENTDPLIIHRSTPYIINEPESSPLDWKLEHNSITRQNFRYKVEASINDEKMGVPYQISTQFGNNDRYGNQYRVIGKDVYSWWHSGHGDLPVVEYETYAEFLLKSYKYAPAYVVEFSIGYIYQTESTGFSQKAPVDLYKNGKYFLSLGEPSGALVCDVAERPNKDLLVLMCSYNSIWMIRYRESDISVQQKTVGTIISCEQLAGWPWRLNSDGTRCGGLIGLRNDANLLTTHLVEFQILEHDGEYSFNEINRTGYTQNYHDTRTSSPVSENQITPNPGGYTYWNVRHTKTGTKVEQDTTITVEYPIAANYTVDDQLSVALLNREIQYNYYTSTTSGNDLNEWAKYYNQSTPVVEYWSISGKDNHSYSNNGETYLDRSFVSRLELPSKTIDIESIMWHQGYQQYNDSNYQEDFGLYDVTIAYGPSAYLAHARKHGFYDNQNISRKIASETVNGFGFQLRHIDVKRATCAWIRIDYSIDRNGDGNKATGTTDHSVTTYVDYLRPTQSITTTTEYTDFAKSIHPDPAYNFNNFNEVDRSIALIDHHKGTIDIETVGLINYSESHPNETYTWTRYKTGPSGSTIYEDGDYAAATQSPNISTKDVIVPIGYYHGGGDGTVTLTQATPPPSDFMFSPFFGTASLVIEPGLIVLGEAYYSELYKVSTDVFNLAFNDAGYFQSPALSYRYGYLEADPVYKSFIYQYLPNIDSFNLEPRSIYPIGFF